MMDDLLTPEEALRRLGERTAGAAAAVLEMFAPGEVSVGAVAIGGTDVSPVNELAKGTITIGVSYTDGVSGANIFALDVAAARTLSSKMGAPPPDPDVDESGEPVALTELELSALSEASNQMIAATASITGTILGQEIEISPPTQHVVEGSETGDLYGRAPHASVTPISVAGQACRLIQLVPAAFIVKMNQALSELNETEQVGKPSTAAGPVADPGSEIDPTAAPAGLSDALSGIELDVWVEIGQVSMTMAEALALPLGSVVSLDRRADAPVELMVNGQRFARGRLVVTDDERWAFALDDFGTEIPADDPGSAFTPLPTA